MRLSRGKAGLDGCMYIRPSWVFSGLVLLSSDRRRSQDRWSGLWGQCWCICESRRQSKVSGCSDLQGTVEPGRNLYSILASAVLDQANDQSWQARGEKEKEEFIYVSSRLLNTRESDDVNIWWCCLVVHVHSGTEEQCGRRRPAVVGVLTIEEQEPDEVTGKSVASDRGE